MNRPVKGVAGVGDGVTTPYPILAEQVIRSALAAPHAYESADGFARRAGFRNRHQVNRVLRHCGLPSYRVIASFVRVLALRDQADAAQRSLCAETIASGFDPAWAYRTVKRVTGHRWTDVRHLSHDDMIALALAHGHGRSGTDSG